MILAYQSEFIDLCVRLGVLRFGSFTLKSGRESPYFFNAGLFNTGAAIGAVGRAYASALAASDHVLYGTALMILTRLSRTISTIRSSTRRCENEPPNLLRPMRHCVTASTCCKASWITRQR